MRTLRSADADRKDAGIEPARDLATRKRDLRKQMRALRGALSPQERATLSMRVARRLLRLPEMNGARTVMAFSSFGTEVRTEELIARLHSTGRRVLLPYLDDAKEIQPARIAPDGDLVASGYGPREPATREPVDPDEIDVVVLPGLAFDGRGHRLGYGGAHYDRFLRRLRPATFRVGIGFGLQVVDQVPTGPADEPVDAVVTEDAVIRSGARERRVGAGTDAIPSV